MPTSFHAFPLSLQTVPTLDDHDHPVKAEDLPANGGQGNYDAGPEENHVSTRAKGQRQTANAVAMDQSESTPLQQDSFLKMANLPVSDIGLFCAT